MYDEFHAHLVGANLKTQKLKLKGVYCDIYAKEMYMLYKAAEMLSIKSAKDIDFQLCIYFERSF